MRSLKNEVIYLLCILLLTTPYATLAQGLPGDDGRWSRLDTAHFTFISQLDEGRTRAMASDLERLRTVLSQMAPNRELSSPNLTYIYLFADFDSFYPFMLQQDGQTVESVAHFTPHPHANYGALNGAPEIEPTRFLYSQFIHQLLAEQLPQLPIWFRQGIAEYYSTFEADDNGAKIGLPSPQHVRSASFGGNLQLVGAQGEAEPLPELTMDDLLAMERAPADPMMRNTYLAYCWGIVHYLLSDEGRQQKAQSFAAQVIGGKDQRAAFQDAFAMTPQDLQREVHAYMQRRDFKYLRLAMDIRPTEGALFRPLPRHEALFYLGDLILHANVERRLDAANYFEAALALARSAGIDHGPSHAALGYVAELGGDMEGASRAYALAVEHAGGDALVQFLYGQSLLATLNQRRPEDETGKERLQQAITSLEASVASRPDFAEAWANLGFAYGLEEMPSGDAVAALSQAQQLLPGRTDIALNLLLAHAKEGQRDEADRLYQRLEWMGASASDLGRAREILLQMDYREANRLVRKENRLDDAIALFTRIQASSQDPNLRQRAAERVEKFAQAQAQNQFNQLFLETWRAVDEALAAAAASDAATPPSATLQSLNAQLDTLRGLAQPGLQQEAVDGLRQRLKDTQP